MDRIARLRWFVFGGSLAVALFMVFVVWHSQSVVGQIVDIYKFADIAKNIASGEGFRYTGGLPTIRRGPGYPALIALLYFVFGAKPVVIQLCQCGLAAGTCVLVFEVGRKLFSERTGLLAAAIVALHPMTMRYVPDIQVETFLTFLYTLTVYRTVRLSEEGTVWNGVWVGVAAAASAMVKAVALPYAALFALCYLIWRRRSAKNTDGPLPGWRPIAAMIVAMGVVILPWTFRNYGLTGRFVLVSGNASGEFLRGYVFAQPRYYLLRDPPYVVGEVEANNMQTELFRSQGLVWEEDEAQTEKVQNLAMKQKVLSEPAAFVKKFVIGLFMFWYVVTTRMNSLVVGGLALLGWIFAAVGWIRGAAQRHRFWLLLVPIGALNVMYAAFLALGRYSAPCIPTLMVLAAFGVDRLLALRSAPSSASKRETGTEVAAAAPSP